MNLYLISQTLNNNWSTFDSAVVAADSEEAARSIHPNGENWDGKIDEWSSWCEKKDVTVRFIGIAADDIVPGVICASFRGE